MTGCVLGCCESEGISWRYCQVVWSRVSKGTPLPRLGFAVVVEKLMGEMYSHSSRRLQSSGGGKGAADKETSRHNINGNYYAERWTGRSGAAFPNR